MRMLICGVSSVIISLVCVQVCLAEGASFRGLGVLGGYNTSKAYAVSAYGNAVVGICFSNGPSNNCEAFIWTEATGMVGLGDLWGGNVDSAAWGVSCDGSYVVGYGNVNSGPFFNPITVPCRWSGPGDILQLGQDNGSAWRISADGLTVVGELTGAGAFRWTEASGMQTLGPGVAYSVSANGQVVVGTMPDANTFKAFRWTEETGMVVLGDLLGEMPFNEAMNVSQDGQVVVGYGKIASGIQAFIWTEAGGMQGLGHLPDCENCNSYAWSVSGDGMTVIGDVNNGRLAFIWDANHGMQNLKHVLENAYGLDLTGWQLLYASDISADGRIIIGYGYDPNGNTQAWMADLGIQQPPSVTLTVQVEPNDIDINTITPAVGEHIYYTGWPVILKAEAFKKCPYVYRFSHWTGDVSDPNSATTILVMTEDKTITAAYYVDQRRCGDECHPILSGDLNKDCYINFEDFAIYCQQWLSCTHPDCD